MNDYEKKQHRKAYALLFVRMHSETGHKARSAYRAGLFMMLAIAIGMDFYVWFTHTYEILCILVPANVILLIALRSS
ncbi:MAG: hypothetical protein WBW94_04485 [Anaerolineales bacterium]